MNSRLSFAIAIVLSAPLFMGCNSDDSTYEVIEDTTVSDVSVTSFSLGANAKIVNNLDSLFFTVDLAHGRIFNADSLPVGTVLGNAVVSISHPTVSKMELIFKNEKGENTTVDYLKNETDSIYFGNGTVKLQVVSANTLVMREYAVTVNVHKVKPDSLFWDETPSYSLPTTISAPSANKVVKLKDKYYSLAGDGSSFTLATAPSVASDDWTPENAVLPANAEVESFTATSDALYILADGMLFTSEDGTTWTSTGCKMTHIYGAYLAEVAGVNKDDSGKYQHISFPSLTTSAAAASCPVSGTSDVVLYESEWSVNPMLMFTGGRRADGTLTGATWAFDGEKWAQISSQSLPDMEGLVMVPYQTMTINNQWVPTYSPVLLAFGGKTADGKIDMTVYMSYNRGVNWISAPAFMQFPSSFTPLCGMQIISETSILGGETSRAVQPITSWECPFLYIFGGYDASGALNTGVWRGALNAFRIKPIQ